MHDTECVSCIDNEPGLLNKDIELSEIEIVIKSLANNKSYYHRGWWYYL